ncbi:hypothetical protein [Burkholderia multivorans]|uniref:hypothetical protein n=1 Tax=Burkholderia multivorans TaxID=87883 RepID=UPI0020B34831|nr:hypothetical protein [Burkholderia multivorans]
MLTRIGRLLFLVVGVCACSITFSGEPTMTNPLLSKPRPWCIGRFVFDRPAASEITNQRYEFRGEKLETQHDAPIAAYHAKVGELERKLKTKKESIQAMVASRLHMSGWKKNFHQRATRKSSLM